MPSTTRDSNRREEHTAIALVNLGRRWALPDGGWFRLLDYQVPLKARQADSRIGKIDLLGVTDRGRLMVIELKVVGPNGSRTDAPPLALMEGVRYAAIVEANLEDIAGEVERRFGAKVARLPPVVQLLAPEGWWRSWLELRAAGTWGPAFARLIAAVFHRRRWPACLLCSDSRRSPRDAFDPGCVKTCTEQKSRESYSIAADPIADADATW